MEFLPDESAVELVKLHYHMKHQPKPESFKEEESSSKSRKNRVMYKVVKCNVQFKKNQSYELSKNK